MKQEITKTGLIKLIDFATKQIKEWQDYRRVLKAKLKAKTLSTKLAEQQKKLHNERN